MTYDEIVHQIPKLSVQERLRLMEMLTHSLQADLATQPTSRLSPDEGEALVSRLFGILKTDGPAPTDEQLREDYTDYLTKKYS